MADKRITDVDFLGSLSSDESFFINQNNSIKQIKKGNITFDIVNGGTGADNAEEALVNLGLTATATELNYCDGVTSNIQTQLNGKAATSHGTHVSYGTSTAALGTASAGSASTVSRSDHVHALPALTSCTGILTVNKGGTGSSNGATGLKNLFAAGNTILSSYQYGDSLPTNEDGSLQVGTVGRIFFVKA